MNHHQSIQFCKSLRRYAVLIAVSIGFSGVRTQARDVASLFDDAINGPDASELISYKSIDGDSLHLHRFEPREDTPELRTAILWYHGGGWQAGNPGQLAPQCRYFSELGILNLSVEYRLATGGRTIMDSVDDARDAFYWVHENAESLGIDPDRIVVAGESAGGHLAAAIGYLPDSRRVGVNQPLPAACLLVNPVLDLTTLSWTQKLPGLAGADPEVARDLSPLHGDLVGKPSAVILHGAEDSVVPPEQSASFATALNAAGVAAKARIWPGKSHAFFLYLPSLGLQDLQAIHPSLIEIEAFLDAEKLTSPPGSAGGFSPVHLFAGDDGFRSFSELIEIGGGLYGNTYKGGHLDFGTVFRLSPETRRHEVLHSFSGTDGREMFNGFATDGQRIFGVGKFGGQFNGGTLFEVRIDGSEFKVLHHFRETDYAGFYPHSGPVLVDGHLYGTTYHGGSSRWGGTVYRFTLPAGPHEVIHSFVPATGRHPTGQLIVVGDWLYGTASDLFQHQTENFGSIYRIHRVNHAFELLHRFNGTSEGGHPYDDLLLHGTDTLIGTNLGEYSSPLSKGTVYSYSIGSGEFRVLHDFAANPGTGSKPFGSLIRAGGGDELYGLTHGSNRPGGDLGTLFRMNPDGSDFTVLHVFSGGLAGNTPMRSLVHLNGAVYGVTAFGGIGEDPADPETGGGIVFRYDLDDTSTLQEAVTATLSFDDERRVVISLHGNPGRRYVIERSTNLKEDSWTSLGWVEIPVSGSIQFKDLELALGESQAFYRTRKVIVEPSD